MSGLNFYLLTSLPPIGELGAQPPMTQAGYLLHVEHAPRPRTEAEAIFLGDDLRQRDALLAAEIDEPTPAVLSVEQLRDEMPLPAFLAPPTADEAAAGPPTLGVDAVWAGYFDRLAQLGRGSAFLAQWVRHEVGLRNALAATRAKALGLDAQQYLVTPMLGAPADEFAPTVGEWSAAETPLAGLRLLDRARWAWLAEHDAWFTFADDELAVFAARLMLMHRWKRIAAAEREAAPAPESQARRPDERN